MVQIMKEEKKNVNHAKWFQCHCEMKVKYWRLFVAYYFVHKSQYVSFVVFIHLVVYWFLVLCSVSHSLSLSARDQTIQFIGCVGWDCVDWHITHSIIVIKHVSRHGQILKRNQTKKKFPFIWCSLKMNQELIY